MSGPSIQVPPASIGTFASVGDITALGTTQLTELAQTFEQFGGDPLARLFTTRTVNNNVIFRERLRKGLGVSPLVQLGGNDRVTDSMTVEQQAILPFHVRESDFIPEYIVNMLRQPGTPNALWGEQMVSERVQRLVARHNLFWQIMRTKMLLGGISYTDPRTGVNLSLSANIPGTNLQSVASSANDFANLTTAKPIQVLRFFRSLIRNVSKADPSLLVMSSELRDILTMMTDVIARQEGFGAGPITKFVAFNDMGELSAIAGMKIETVDTIYEDPVTGVKQKVWPIEKIACVVESHPEAPGVTPGRLDYCIGEGPTPGLWMRDGGPTLPPSAPGRSMQLGNSGVPYLQYPEWVGILTVSTPAALNALIPQNVI